MRPIDYAVMIGGPLIFLLIATVGLRALIGPEPRESVVRRLRDGAVRPGMTEAEVRRSAGLPKGTAERPDGGFTYRYQSSSWDAARNTMLEEDAYIEFDANGSVTTITFDSRVPPR